MNGQTIVTIVMPVFNGKEKVKCMIDSILLNHYSCWKLLLVDDGSEEETLRLLQEYEKTDSRIQLICRDCKPKGAQTCRNIGLRMVDTEYVLFFDSDDFVADYCLQQRVEAISHHPDLDFMVFPTGVFINGKPHLTYHMQDMGVQLGEDELALLAERFLPFTVWTNIYRTESLRSLHLEWDTQLQSLQDSAFNLQAITHGMTFGYSPTSSPDYFYRIDHSSTSIASSIPSNKHRESHFYWLNLTFILLQDFAGHRYDRSICRGAIRLYHYYGTNNIDRSFLHGIVNITQQYAPFWGRILKSQALVLIFLSNIIPYKRARQMVFYFYYRHRIRLSLKKRSIICNQRPL